MIIVPIDGSQHSHHALDYAVTIALSLKEELLLLNVQPKNDGQSFSEGIGMDRWTEEKLTLGKQQLSEAIRIIEGKIPFETIIRVGIPSIEITTLAKEKRATTIIMGSRGNGPAVSAILGSVTYGVLHLSPCPVTIVPDRKDSL
ncbi:universal stress protein [Salipaludibacillus sp. CF4.18]|uniref:universal stress protein n=1 Tax=Salipaludibacillus sp. CF4.18 TaxID=3373081 RepID=UPI003EE48A1A